MASAGLAQGTAALHVSDAHNPTPAVVLIVINGDATYATIPPMAPAHVKKEAIADALRDKGYDVAPTGASSELVVQGLAEPVLMKFYEGRTAEEEDEVYIPSTGLPRWISGEAIFESPHFAPFDLRGQPAVFTAGIVTDVGELTVRVSAQELSFQTDGPIICQALFQRLAPRAPQYGAQINYAGDRLEVYFDPAYTVTQGGIIFGTSSQSEGVGGAIQSQQVTPPCRADFNHDGTIDFFDYDDFVMAFINGDTSADFNGDGSVDFFDYDDFVLAFEAGC
jgi:hypothetical protein